MHGAWSMLVYYVLSSCGAGDTQGAGIYGDTKSNITLAGGSTVARNTATKVHGACVGLGIPGVCFDFARGLCGWVLSWHCAAWGAERRWPLRPDREHDQRGGREHRGEQ